MQAHSCPKAAGLWVWQLVTARPGLGVGWTGPWPRGLFSPTPTFRGPAGGQGSPSCCLEAGPLHPSFIHKGTPQVPFPPLSGTHSLGSRTYNWWTPLFTCLGALPPGLTSPHGARGRGCSWHRRRPNQGSDSDTGRRWALPGRPELVCRPGLLTPVTSSDALTCRASLGAGRWVLSSLDAQEPGRPAEGGSPSRVGETGGQSLAGGPCTHKPSPWSPGAQGHAQGSDFHWNSRRMTLPRTPGGPQPGALGAAFPGRQVPSHAGRWGGPVLLGAGRPRGPRGDPKATFPTEGESRDGGRWVGW